MSILWVSTGIRQLHATLLVFQGPFQDYLTTFKTDFWTNDLFLTQALQVHIKVSSIYSTWSCAGADFM